MLINPPKKILTGYYKTMYLTGGGYKREYFMFKSDKYYSNETRLRRSIINNKPQWEIKTQFGWDLLDGDNHRILNRRYQNLMIKNDNI